MADLEITPQLRYADIQEMFDPAENDKLVQVNTGTLSLLGGAPAGWQSRYRSQLDRVFYIDIGAGLNYYRVPADDFAAITWHDGLHLFRLSTAPLVISEFVFLLR